MEKNCEKCKKVFKKSPSDSKKYWAKKRFCSIACSGTLFKKGFIPANKGKSGPRGADNPNWKGGRYISVQGYVVIRIDGAYILEHRHIMQEHLGRKLGRNEHVHHMNHDKQDNRLDNLKVVDAAEHNREHTLERWQSSRPFRKGLANG